VEKAFKDHSTLYTGFEALANDPNIADSIKLKEASKKVLVDLIQKSIKPPVVYVDGYLELRSYEPDGIKTVKSALDEIKKHESKDCKISLSYVAAPHYRIKVSSSDYKHAEKALKKSVDQGINFINSKNGFGEFHRELGEK
jgi:translation initiation factor 2 subunit 1